LDLDLDQKQTIAFNGLNYVAAFRGAFSEANVKERVSIEHMETFFFIMTAHKQDSVELRRLQKALGYAQAKMHRTASVLETLGWITTQDSAADARQKDVFITDKGHAFFDKITKSLSEKENDSIFVKRSEDMRDDIEEDKAIRDIRDVEVTATDPQKFLEEMELLAEEIKSDNPSEDAIEKAQGIVAKAKGMVSRHSATKKIVVDLKDAYQRHKIHEQIQKDAAKARAAIRQDKHRARLRDAISVLEDGPIEVGANYVKTSRGIVTFAVLLKRINTYDPELKARSIAQIGLTIATMNERDYDRLMTPSPKTKLKRLEAELFELKHRTEMNERLGGHDGPAHIQAEANRLAQLWHAKTYELQALEAKEQLMSDTDENDNDFVPGQNGTEMADGSWVYTTSGEYTEEQAQIDAAMEELETKHGNG
jgi:DNA-binding MarR family transcriptional regulator